MGLKTVARCIKNRVAPLLGETELEIRYPIGTSTFTSQVPVFEAPVGTVLEAKKCVSAVV